MKFSLALAVLPALACACGDECTEAVATYAVCILANCISEDTTTCPANCQPCFDAVYSTCGGCDITGEGGVSLDFDEYAKTGIKPVAEVSKN